MSVYQKILQAQKALGYVEKKGRNNFSGYGYATEADVLHSVKTAANDAGLILLTSTTTELGVHQIDNKSMRWAKTVLAYKVIDADTGETLEGTFDGYAEDKGDKAVYKATTGANKYFLMKFFGVNTGDDPERDDEPPVVQPAKPVKSEPKQKIEKAQEQPAKPQAEKIINKDCPSILELKNSIYNLVKGKDISIQRVHELSGGQVKDMNDPSKLADLLAALQAL